MRYLPRWDGPPILNLVCQGAGGLGGQDWDGPHLVVGRLVLGHTARECVGGVGSTGHYQDIAWRRVSRFIGSDPTHILMPLVVAV